MLVHEDVPDFVVDILAQLRHVRVVVAQEERVHAVGQLLGLLGREAVALALGLHARHSGVEDRTPCLPQEHIHVRVAGRGVGNHAPLCGLAALHLVSRTIALYLVLVLHVGVLIRPGALGRRGCVDSCVLLPPWNGDLDQF